MVVDPKDFVIKVYTTKTDADAGLDTTALDVDSISSGKIAGYQDDQYFLQFTKYYYRFDFNEPAMGIEIDWDDGDDNSPEKANRQLIKFESPKFFVVVDHIYTRYGRFFPLARVINKEGFYSKWYTSSDSNNDYSALDARTLPAGQNYASIISTDSDVVEYGKTYARIPFFTPTILPPKAVLKIDKKTIKAGIDSERSLGVKADNGEMLPGNPYIFYSGESTTYPSSGVNKEVKVNVTYYDTTGRIRTETLSTKYNSNNKNALSYGCKKVLKMELVNLVENSTGTSTNIGLNAGERVYLRNPAYSTHSFLHKLTTSAQYTTIRRTINGTSGRAGGSYTYLDSMPGDFLDAAISGTGGTSITVYDASKFVASVDKILIDTEIMTISNVNTSTNVLTVARGQEQTTAATHSDNAKVTLYKDNNSRPGPRLHYHDSVYQPHGATTYVGVSGTDNHNGIFQDHGHLALHECVLATHDSGNKTKITLDSGDSKFRAGMLIDIFVGSSSVDGLSRLVTEVADGYFVVNVAWSNNSIGGGNTAAASGSVFAASVSDLIIEDAYVTEAENHGVWFVPDFAIDPSICNVSQGWPIIEYNDPSTVLWTDSSESRTRAPELSITEDSTGSASYLRLDNGKGFSQAADTGAITDVFSTNMKQPTHILPHRYTNDPFIKYANPWHGNRSYLDGALDVTADGADGIATNRFYDEYRLLRLQVYDTRDEAIGGETAFSTLENFTDYLQTSNTTKNIPSSLESKNLLYFTSDNGTTWSNKEGYNDSDDDDNTGTYPAYGNFPGFTITQQDIDLGPKNFIHVVMNRKFDRIHFSMSNRFGQGLDQHGVADDRAQGGKIRLSLYYPVRNNLTAQTNWTPLDFVDFTKTNLEDTSLYLSGPITFDIPGDWASTYSSLITWPTEDGSSTNAGVGQTFDLAENSNWTSSGYSVLIGIAWEGTVSNTFETNSPAINYLYPYDNTHSQLVKIVDPMHVSINDIPVAQSLSWVRNGKFVEIEDRFGKAEMRKIGAKSGSIKIGGVAFGDYSTATDSGYTALKKMQKYQKEATPIYYDNKRPNGSYIRFYGKIMSLSEDVPTKRLSNKWAINMKVTHVLEFNSDGTMITDGLISLGGNIDDSPRFA